MKIILNDLPKISLNKWYSGEHWSKRKKLKDKYKLLIKSFSEKWNSLRDFIKKNHPYDVAEISNIPINDVSKDYLDWMIDVIK